MVGISGVIAVLSVLALYLVPTKNYFYPLESFVILTATLLATAQILIPKFVNKFSNLSYSFYLIHYYVILIVGKVLDFTVFSWKTVLGAIVVFGVTLVISICSYQIIEVWLCNILKKWFIKK